MPTAALDDAWRNFHACWAHLAFWGVRCLPPSPLRCPLQPTAGQNRRFLHFQQLTWDGQDRALDLCLRRLSRWDQCHTQDLVRKFNTEGPMVPQRHYCIPPLSRINLEEVLELVEDMRYFVLHAPRQTGKTSTLKALAEHFNSRGEYGCVYVNVELAQTAREDVHRAMRVILGQIAGRAESMLQDTFVRKVWPHVLAEHGGDGALNETLRRWAVAAPRPLVLLIDEIDTLQGDSLISALRQLRAGYDERPLGFPQSVILCGVRDVRDYRIFSTSEGTHVSGGSAFNVKAKSLRLEDFGAGEVADLLAQHTAETGQAFASGTVERVWGLTRGQPWLVNALALEACFEGQGSRDRSRPVETAAIERAREALIRGRVTHLDQLAARLRERRVQRVVEPLIEGNLEPGCTEEDIDYVRDLGLIAQTRPLRIANPIYSEVVPRQLTSVLEDRLAGAIRPESYRRRDGSLNLGQLLRQFQRFFRDHSDHWVERFGYREAGPQLILQAFLQRVVNSGGRIEREFGLGRMRTDLLVCWPIPRGGECRYVIECKVLRPGRSLETTVGDGLRQTAAYMDASGAAEGHLVIFDLRAGRTWSQRLFRRQGFAGPVEIGVWGA